MKTMLALVAAIGLASSNCVAAQLKVETGENLLRNCESAIRLSNKEQLSANENVRGLWCGAYIAGFLDGAEANIAITKSARKYCLPSNGESFDVVLRKVVPILQRRTDLRSQASMIALFMALSEAYPCS